MTNNKDEYEYVKDIKMPITRNQFDDYMSAAQNLSNFFNKTIDTRVKIIPHHRWTKDTERPYLFNEDVIDGAIGRGIDAVVDLLALVMHDDDLLTWWFYEAEDDKYLYTGEDGYTTRIDTIDVLWDQLRENYAVWVLCGGHLENPYPYTGEEEEVPFEPDETDNVDEADD